MSDNQSDSAVTYEILMDRIRNKAKELREAPTYDIRKEKEIDDLYNQYIPPYAIQGNESLIDIAERDAYVNAFPPLGSQKKGGIVIKKTIRSAIGWYMQFVTQQISTFGSGVARALRSMSNDIEELKRNVGTSGGNDFVYSLNLVPSAENLGDELVGLLADHKKETLLVSDSVDASTLQRLNDHMRVVVVDPRPDSLSTVDPSIDTRRESLGQFLNEAADGSFASVVLSGWIECVDPKLRYEIITQANRVGCPGSSINVIVSQESAGDLQLACEVLGTKLWSVETWEKVLSHYAHDVRVTQLDESFVLISGVTASAG